MAPFSVRPPVHSTTVSSPWAASTEIACSTLARQDAVENGRTMPVVPRIEMPPMMPSLALVVLRAIFSPSGTEMIIWTPLLFRSTASPTAWVIIARGTGLMAGPPSSRPRPGLVTTPTPTPPSSSIPGSLRQRTVAVSRAPCVTSGSSPASLTTTASAVSSGVRRAGVHGEADPRPDGRPIWTVSWISPVCSAVVAAFAAAAAQVPVVQPVRSACFLTFAVRGRSGSRSSGSSCWVTGLSGRGRGFAKLLPGLPVRLAETVEMAWVVQVGPAAAGGQAGPDKAPACASRACVP